MAQGSERVRQRTGRLIKLVELLCTSALCETAATGEGSYKAFWNVGATMPNGRQSVAFKQVISEPK